MVPKPADFSRKQAVYNIESQSSYNYTNEYTRTSKAGLHGASINPMTQIFHPIYNTFTPATLKKMYMFYTLKTMGELSTFSLVYENIPQHRIVKEISSSDILEENY